MVQKVNRFCKFVDSNCCKCQAIKNAVITILEVKGSN